MHDTHEPHSAPLRASQGHSRTITLLADYLADSQAQADRQAQSDLGRSYYQGRAEGFKLALELLQEART